MNNVFINCVGANYADTVKDFNSVATMFGQKRLSLNDSGSIFENNTPQLGPQRFNYFEQMQKSAKDDTKAVSAMTQVFLGKDVNDAVQKVSKKDYPGALISASQAAINLPNTIDDAIDAIDQTDKYLKSRFYGENFKYTYKKAYNFKNAQHPFSYFRGTLLKDLANPNSPHCPSKPLARWLAKHDVTLCDTKFGRSVKKSLGVQQTQVKTSIKHVTSTDAKKVNVKAYKFVSKSSLGKLTARSMTRVPVFGLVVAGALEGCQVANEVSQGEDAVKSIGKAAVRLASSTAITAVLGAIGAAIAGPAGSVVGICLGGLLSNEVAKAIA